MSDDAKDRRSAARARYRALMRERPDWFVNHPGGFEILTDDEEMDRAEEEAFARLQDSRRGAGGGAGVERSWVTVGVLAEDAWGVVLRDAVRTPQGRLSVYRREMTAPDRPAGVAAVAMLDGRFVLLKHYRHALRRFSWEFPRGFSRRGEAHETAVRRQLAEEIQARARALRDLGFLEPDGGKLGDRVHLVMADIETPGAAERAEAIEGYEVIDLEELRRRVREGEITDSFTLAAIGKAYCEGLL